MENKKLEEQLRAGEEAIKRARKVMDGVTADKARHEEILKKQKEELENDPFLKKLRQASTAVLDRVIERNQPPDTAPKSSVGRNLERLRLECGWSYERLAHETKLDKALIWRHVKKGKGCSPKTLKYYADAFSVGLKRPVSVEEIKSPVPKLTTK